jgi:hypothetical protein
MNAAPFMQFSLMAALVRKYQDRWQFCLVSKARSYYWPGGFAP